MDTDILNLQGETTKDKERHDFLTNLLLKIFPFSALSEIQGRLLPHIPLAIVFALALYVSLFTLIHALALYIYIYSCSRWNQSDLMIFIVPRMDT